MGLVVIRTFLDITEAHVAAGALRAAGFHVALLDVDMGTTNWLYIQAIGGFRLGVPQDEAEAATAWLNELRRRADPPPQSAPSGGARTALTVGAIATAGWMGLGVALPWLLARRKGFSREDVYGIVIALVGAAILVALATLIGRWFWIFLTYGREVNAA